MPISPLQAVQAYSAAAGAAKASAGAGAGAAAEAAAPKASFADMMAQMVNESQNAGTTAETAAIKGAAGEAQLVDVVTAISAAEVTLETVVAVRDKVVSAYQEILRMPM